MSRRLIALLATLLSLVFLAGCGDDDDKATDNGSADDSTPPAAPAATPPDREPTGVSCDYPEDPRGASKEVEPPPTDATVSGARNFGGTGTADQSNALSGEVSVTVAEVLPNGTMVVQGQKTVTLNRGDEFVQIRGIVRPADISADNRVLSTRVADARIAYTGRGDVARAARQGWFSRFFQTISPF